MLQQTGPANVAVGLPAKSALMEAAGLLAIGGSLHPHDLAVQRQPHRVLHARRDERAAQPGGAMDGRSGVRRTASPMTSYSPKRSLTPATSAGSPNSQPAQVHRESDGAAQLGAPLV